MSMIGFPLLLIPIAIYNIIALMMPGVSFSDTLLTTKLVSGAAWAVTLGDMLTGLGVLLLLIEIIKGARPGAKYLTDHLLSLIVFGGAAAEFLMWSKFATSTYFLLTLLAMVDFLSGIALRTRRVATVTAVAPVTPAPAHPVDAPPAEPASLEPDPAPLAESNPDAGPREPVPAAPEVVSAASIAESVLMDHPEPKIAREPKIEPDEVPLRAGAATK